MIHKIEEAPFDVRSATSRLCSKASHALKIIADSVHHNSRIPFDITELEYAVNELVKLKDSIGR